MNLSWVWRWDRIIRPENRRLASRGWDRTIRPEDYLLASRGLPSDEKRLFPRDGLFYPILTQIIDSFSCSPLNTSFYIWQHEKRLPENLYHCNDVTEWRTADENNLRYLSNLIVMWKKEFNTHTSVVLHLVYALRKGDKMLDKPCIVSLFLNSVKTFNKAWALV